MVKFKNIKIGEVFTFRGETYEKAEPCNVCTFEPYNANEGPARYQMRNAINIKSGLYAQFFVEYEIVEEIQLTML